VADPLDGGVEVEAVLSGLLVRIGGGAVVAPRREAWHPPLGHDQQQQDRDPPGGDAPGGV
jgi:hypothetical protein